MNAPKKASECEELMRKRTAPPQFQVSAPKRQRTAEPITTIMTTTNTAMQTEENTGVNYVPPKRFVRRNSKKGRKLTARQKGEVNKIINRRSELKYVLTNSTATGQPSTWTVAKLATINQGDADSTRDGDRLTWCGNMEIHLQVVNAIGATGDIYNNLRVVIFQWHPVDTVAPVAADLFGIGNTGAVDYSSHYYHDKRQLYTVLFDRVYKTVGNGVNANQPLTNDVQSGLMMYSLSIARANKQVQYNNASTSGTNQFYIATCSDSAVATHPTILYSIKTFFRDI